VGAIFRLTFLPVASVRHNARCRAPALTTAALIVRQSVRGGVRRPSSKRAGKSPLHTKCDTSSRFWVSNGITKQHGAQECQRRLCEEITRNHEKVNSDKTIENIGQN
jgi:hypothetical protein